MAKKKRRAGVEASADDGGGVRFPDVKVRLIGTDGNVFALTARVSDALRRAGHREAASELADQVAGCGSYDEALRLFMRTVDVS